ncbi:penicillin-binding protein 2 [bacterium]|nr:penicillin-binding protein 2 [bacterium]
MISGRPLSKRGELIPAIVVIVLFSVLAIRLFDLQVVRASTYRRLSEENRIRLIPVDAPRGHILDRHGEVLVCNRPSYVVSILPFMLKEMERTIQRLSRILNVDPQEIVEKVSQRRWNRFAPVKIKRDIDFKTLAIIQEHKLDLPGVIYQVEPRREYLQGQLAAHLLGTVGEISPRELETHRGHRYRYGSLIGKAGLERQYEPFLRGEDGVQYVEVSAVGREIGPLADRPPAEVKPGSDLILTIDLALQKVAEEALSDTVCGAVVAIDPTSGEVLAMVSRPTFDPNLFSTVVPESTWRQLNEDPGHPLLNRAIQCSYPPASTMKPVTAGAGLKYKVIGQHTRFAPCSGAYKYGNRWFRCWRPEGHGSLALVGAVAQSCDVYFYQLGLKIGLEHWSEFAADCGFGVPLGLDLPNETGGLIPDQAFYDRRYGKRKWSPGVLLNLSIGQGENLVTPLQMACFTAAIANGGIIYRPFLVREIRSVAGKSLPRDPQIVGHLPLSADNLKIIKRSLRAVVGDIKGTGRQAAIEGVAVAGKTGTAQNPHGEDHAWFIGFAPLDDPRIAIAVLVELGGHGGSVAAPIAGKVMEAYLKRGGL